MYYKGSKNRFVSTGGHCLTKTNKKLIRQKGEGVDVNKTKPALNLIQAFYSFPKKSFAEVLNLSRLHVSKRCKGKPLQSLAARYVKVIWPKFLLADGIWSWFVDALLVLYV